jgi:hypothetical protein
VECLLESAAFFKKCNTLTHILGNVEVGDIFLAAQNQLTSRMCHIFREVDSPGLMHKCHYRAPRLESREMMLCHISFVIIMRI